ncbi:MAG: amidohydrolase family protein [Alphaproteobacteria bacterium]|nr:amidohydrolase family protein [Alphaproteobacteria bacterium]
MRAKEFGLSAALAVAAMGAMAQERPGASPAPEPPTVLHVGSLLAIPGQPPRQNVSVIVRGTKFDQIADAFIAIDGARVVDLKDHFALPGLMDAHVHVRSQPSDFARGQGIRQGRLQPLPSDLAVNALIYARRNLAAGFTTLRDLGSDDQSVFAARDAITMGRMVGPRILAAGPALSATGGHADTSTVEGDQTNARLFDGVCDGPDECTRAVRFIHKLGADVIKFTATGGFSST